MIPQGCPNPLAPFFWFPCTKGKRESACKSQFLLPSIEVHAGHVAYCIGNICLLIVIHDTSSAAAELSPEGLSSG